MRAEAKLWAGQDASPPHLWTCSSQKKRMSQRESVRYVRALFSRNLLITDEADEPIESVRAFRDEL